MRMRRVQGLSIVEIKELPSWSITERGKYCKFGCSIVSETGPFIVQINTQFKILYVEERLQINKNSII